MWEYRARLIKVIDGDTIDMEIDVGFHGRQIERLRLLGVNTPERGQPDWALATSATRAWLEYRSEAAFASEWPLVIETQKADSFGRYLAKVWADDGECLNDHLRARWPDTEREYR